jgi:hypothetical protein
MAEVRQEKSTAEKCEQKRIKANKILPQVKFLCKTFAQPPAPTRYSNFCTAASSRALLQLSKNKMRKKKKSLNLEF